LLGADDTDFCVLLATACFLESRLTAGPWRNFTIYNSVGVCTRVLRFTLRAK